MICGCGKRKIQVSPIIPKRRTSSNETNTPASDATSSVVKRALIFEQLENEVTNNNIDNVKKIINKNKKWITKSIIQLMLFNSQSIEMEIMLNSYM